MELAITIVVLQTTTIFSLLFLFLKAVNLLSLSNLSFVKVIYGNSRFRLCCYRMETIQQDDSGAKLNKEAYMVRYLRIGAKPQQAEDVHDVVAEVDTYPTTDDDLNNSTQSTFNIATSV